jgi:fumarate reductase flavoprotein subunit
VADILIIGAGTAGITAAIQAAKRGKQVVVVEKCGFVGGTLHYTAGHLSAAGTRLQQTAGISDTPEQHFQDIARICGNTMDAIITRKAVELAPGTVNWLQDLGYPFHERAPAILYGHEAYSIARTYFGKDDVSPKMNRSGKTIWQILQPLWEEQINKGTIQLITHCKLIGFRHANHQITGVVVENKGEQQILSAQQYILTTGGYAANPSFFQAHTPGGSRLLSAANPASTGDGIKAVMNIGGIFWGGDKQMFTLGGIETEPESGRIDFWNAWARMSNSKDRKQREIYVNDRGERCMNEYDWSVDQRERVIREQPNKRCWVIFDAKALRDGDCIIPQWTAEQLEEESVKGKSIWQADSIESLASKTGLPLDSLQATVNGYNEACLTQQDPQFQRTYLQHPIVTPPFFAILTYAYALISFGGIRVNEQLQVLTEGEIPINNLYAAGEVLGAAATSGEAFCGGMLITPALSFGKWLGDTL